MNVADISIHPPAGLRRVGIVYPDRSRVMSDAVRIYQQLGVALEVEADTISLLVPQPAASFYAGMLERFTGRMAFNEWLA